MTPSRSTKKAANRSATDGVSGKMSSEERAAVRERAQELKSEAGRARGGKKADGEADLLAKVREMKGNDREMAERLHALMKSVAPELSPKTWYGMPAWARDGKVVCFFQAAGKFKTRYATFGFSEDARLDDGAMWPTSFALVRLTSTEEARISELVRKASG